MKVLLIGIGQAGIDIMDNISEDLSIPTLAIDLDKYALHSSDADHTIYVKESHIEDTAELSIHSHVHIDAMDELRPILQPYDVIYIVGALGGRAGGVIIPAVAKEARDMGKKIRGKIIMPFRVEESKREIAEVYVDHVKELFTDVDIYDNHEYIDNADQEITLDSVYSLNSIFEEINRDILREIQRDIVYEQQ